ncbi:MAG: thioredoxin family protein [Phycisphaerales bacterium]|nr:MAG: thioredoxin family protein [Phycisphaerales bacterium]
MKPMNNPTPKPRSRALANTLVFTVVIALLLVGQFFLFRASPVPTPELFGGRTSLQQAMADGAQAGKPVFAMATADWCGPCQQLKAGALQDERLVAFLTEHTVPVYIDVDVNGSDANTLGVRGIPALYLIGPDGEPLAQTVGSASAEALLHWAQTAINNNEP